MEPIPAHLDHPAFATKCSACEMLQQDVRQCEKFKCCFAYQRRGHEGRQRDDARLKDERERNLSQEEGGNDGEKVPPRPSLYPREIQEDSRTHLIDSQGATPASPIVARVCGRSSFPLPPSCQGEDPDERR
jgi:hypothetical protein